MKRVRISHQSDNLRDWVEANGELIGKGKDATIYALNNSAYVYLLSFFSYLTLM